MNQSGNIKINGKMEVQHADEGSISFVNRPIPIANQRRRFHGNKQWNNPMNNLRLWDLSVENNIHKEFIQDR